VFLLDPEEVLGRVPRERILTDEWIRSDRLASPRAGLGLSAVIPQGMRTVSVDISDGAALRGLLEPGSAVDVLATLESEEPVQPGGVVRSVTRTILQGVLVIAVDDRLERVLPDEAGPGNKVKPSVTLLVTPDQATQVVHAATVGEIVLTLRNDGDVEFAALGGVDLDDIRSRLVVQKRVVRRPGTKPPPKRCLEFVVILGERREVVQVDEHGVPCS
jgi:pilus assembly protein CpaB